MPTVSSKVNQKEYDAISEFANQCGESISNVIKKSVLSEATFRLFYGDAIQYEITRIIPDHLNEDDYELSCVNKIRKILSLEQKEEI